MTDATEMELRVAEALAEFQYGTPNANPSQQHFREARVAIEAMRDPPDEMLKEAGGVENWGMEQGCHQYHDEWHIDFWNRMIDAALAKPK